MEQSLLHMRRLSLDDQVLVQNMQTSVEDDYILHIFPDLVTSKTNNVYGLFQQDNLLAIAGASFYPGGYAMLGRLRSDTRFLAKGNATNILGYIKSELEKDPAIKWVGANTNLGNKAARRVLEKIGLDEVTRLHSYSVAEPDLVNGTAGAIWQPIHSIEEKRALLNGLTGNATTIYPYECYYPFPLTDQLLTDEHLEDSVFFQNPKQDRFMVIKKDQKRDWYAQVKYFWNDHFYQPGWWETVYHYVGQQPEEGIKAWIDFSEQGLGNIPNLEAFDVSDGWILYGKWV
ncbi:N-acetyltransferase [Aquibacillus koreensis]|uniref:N-acetyltransferase n=1 Tax=Aquibacillus koreensis TaxID=279446 RepID=A0A9X4AJM3_9BACI|nr:N-acetyltransferase [Aquibacillus koreensis]MCT2536017.1 N-acetyltransferase [Aquibacillus koreensis]MDC3420473.1 N-acetyltransferase [Aquibacillus koreensis]